MKTSVLVLALFLISIVPINSVFAHSEGTSYTIENNGYTIDIGYNSPALESGESVIFDFEISKNDERFSDFTDVWVRIEGENGTVFATGVHNADFGGARLSYIFPGPGDYTVSARYQNNDDAVASAKFPITVLGEVSTAGKASSGVTSSILISGAVGLLLGFVVTSLIRGRR